MGDHWREGRQQNQVPNLALVQSLRNNPVESLLQIMFGLVHYKLSRGPIKSLSIKHTF